MNGGSLSSHHPSGPGSTHSESSSNHSTSPFGVLPHQESSQVGPGSISSGYYSSSASSTGSSAPPPSCMVAAYGHGLGLPDVASSSSVPGVAIAGGETNPNLSGVIPEEIEFPAIVSTFPPEPYQELRLDPSAAVAVTSMSTSSSLSTGSSRPEKKSKSDRTKKKMEKRKNKEKVERDREGRPGCCFSFPSIHEPIESV